MGFFVIAAAALTAFLLYGRQTMTRRVPDSPETAAEIAVRADNTAVGLLGGIHRVEIRSVEREGDGTHATATVVAEVEGGRDTATLRAELRTRDGRWLFVDGALVFPEGRTIPIRGSPGY